MIMLFLGIYRSEGVIGFVSFVVCVVVGSLVR